MKRTCSMLSAVVALGCGGASTTAQTTGGGDGTVESSTPNGGNGPISPGMGGASNSNGGSNNVDATGGQGGGQSNGQGGALGGASNGGSSTGGSAVSGGGVSSSPGGASGSAGNGGTVVTQPSDVPEVSVVRSVLTGEGTFDCAVDVATDGSDIYVIDRGSTVLYDPDVLEQIDPTLALRKLSFDVGSEWSVPLDGVVAAAVTVSDAGEPVTVALSGAADGTVAGRMLVSTRSATDGMETDSWQGEQLAERSYYGLAFAETTPDGSLLLGVSGQLVRFDGAPVWTYDGPEAIYALWLQGDGAFYLGGQVTPDRGAESWVARLDATGSTSWSYQEKLTAPTQVEFGVAAVAADEADNAYAIATHIVDDEPGPVRWALVKASPSGQAEWRVDLGAYDNYSQNGVEYLVGTVAPADVVVVGDEVVVLGAKDGDLWLAGFDAAGQLLWERRHSGANPGPDEATKAVLLEDGTLLVAGCETIRLEPGNDGSFCANVVEGPCEPPAIPITSAWVGIVELP